MPKPTVEHEKLLTGIGSYTGTLTSFMPGAPSEPIPVDEEVVSVGGFWTHSRFTGTFMGQPYVGTGSLGYDVANECYVGTWVDSMTSYLAIMEGQRDPATGVLIMRWQTPGPDGKTVAHRSETAFRKWGYIATFYAGEGAGTKSMLITMRRK